MRMMGHQQILLSSHVRCHFNSNMCGLNYRCNRLADNSYLQACLLVAGHTLGARAWACHPTCVWTSGAVVSLAPTVFWTSGVVVSTLLGSRAWYATQHFLDVRGCCKPGPNHCLDVRGCCRPVSLAAGLL